MNTNLQVKIKNKKRYSQASKHLRMPGTNLKIIKLATSNLMQTKTFLLK